MAKRGKRSGKAAGQADAPTEHDRRDFRRLVRKAGGRKRLFQWIGEKAPRAPWRPRNAHFDTLIDGILAEVALYKELSLGPAPLTSRRRIRALVKSMWKAHEKNSQDPTVLPEMRAAWDPHHLGKDVNAAMYRPLKELRRRKIETHR